MIDYMLSRGIPPVIGSSNPGDVGVIDGPVIVDQVAVHVIYRSYLADLALRLTGSLKIYAPSTLEPQIQVLEAVRARRGLNVRSFIDYVEVSLQDEETHGRILLSDDVRVRAYASRLGVRAVSSLSIVETYIARFGRLDNIEEVLLSLKSIPVMIPREVEERWLGITR
jgi:hypothetical protein